MPSGMLGSQDREDALGRQAVCVDDVVGEQVVRRAVVADVRASSRRVRTRGRSACRSGRRRSTARARPGRSGRPGRAASAGGGNPVGIRSWVGEPDRTVARDDDIVGRVERQPATGVEDRLGLARRRVHGSDRGGLFERALLFADEQAAAVDPSAMPLAASVEGRDCVRFSGDSSGRSPSSASRRIATFGREVVKYSASSAAT